MLSLGRHALPYLDALFSTAMPPHRLHGPERAWPESNCYLDLWIELLHALDRDPLPLLGLAAGLDWEADHFSFLKPSAADIVELTGVTVHELAMWDDTEAHVVAQITAGAIPILEVNAYFLPDTVGTAYHRTQTKTSIAITAVQPELTRLSYFHNSGHFNLCGDDYAGILGREPYRPGLFPFAELARVAAAPAHPARARALARQHLVRHARTRAPGNPVARFAAALPALLDRVGSDAAHINALCFNTTRQLGSTFGLFADHLAWLGEPSQDALLLADLSKTLQFQISRAARRRRADPAVGATLDQMTSSWERCLGALPS